MEREKERANGEEENAFTDLGQVGRVQGKSISSTRLPLNASENKLANVIETADSSHSSADLPSPPPPCACSGMPGLSTVEERILDSGKGRR